MSRIFSIFSVTSLLSIVLALQILSCSSQSFDPDVDDKEYLDTIQKRLHREAMDAHAVLINQTKLLQQLTRTFIETKIRENLFKAVRERVEVELEEMAKNSSYVPSLTPPSSSTASSYLPPSSPSSRQGRQDEEDDDDATPAPTVAPRRPGLLPQLANVVSTLFGSDVNVTSYLTDATAFLPTDISNRILTAASLIDPNRFTSTTPKPQPQLIVNGQVIPQGSLVNGTSYVYSQVGLPQQGIQTTTFIQQPIASSPPQPINTFTNGNFNNNNQVVPPAANQASSQQLQQQQPQQQQQQASSQIVPYIVPQSSVSIGTGAEQRQDGNNVGVQPISQLGTIQQPSYSVGGDNLVTPDNNGASQLQSPPAALPNDQVPNFKVNDLFIPSVRRSTTPAFSSNEDEDDENNSSEKTSSKTTKNPQDEEDSVEDDLPISKDDELFLPRDEEAIFNDEKATASSYLDEYPVVKYGLKLFQVLTATKTAPTTTEYYNVTTVAKTLDSIEEEEARATPAAAPSTYKQVVQTGIYLFEGAREAYQLLQNINGYLDKIGNRLDNAGYGPEDVGVELDV